MALEHPLCAYLSNDFHTEVWTDQWRFQQERILWVEIMRHQAKLGVFDHVEDWDRIFRCYVNAIDLVSVPSILRRERFTKHDVKARIEIFNEKATYLYNPDPDAPTLEYAHWGLTSADIVDNISLLQMLVAAKRLESSARVKDKPYIVDAMRRIQERIPFRGIKGPVGTQQDILDLFEGDEGKVMDLEIYLYRHFGFEGGLLGSVGQVYPRSIDGMIGSYLLVATDGKMPWVAIARGYINMLANMLDQWAEGDVSTSAIRRVALPGIFLSAACALEN